MTAVGLILGLAVLTPFVAAVAFPFWQKGSLREKASLAAAKMAALGLIILFRFPEPAKAAAEFFGGLCALVAMLGWGWGFVVVMFAGLWDTSELTRRPDGLVDGYARMSLRRALLWLAAATIVTILCKSLIDHPFTFARAIMGAARRDDF